MKIKGLGLRCNATHTDDLVGKFTVIGDDAFLLITVIVLRKHCHRQSHGNGPTHNHRVANLRLEYLRILGDALGGLELIHAQLHAHFRHFDIHPGLDRVENDAPDLGRRPHRRGAKTGRQLMELTELVDQQGKSDQAERIRIGWHDNLMAAEDPTLGRP